MAFRILFVQIYIVSLEMPTDYRYSCEKPRFTHNLNSPEELGLSLKYSMNGSANKMRVFGKDG